MSEPLFLTDLDEAAPLWRRFAHGYATSGTWVRLAARGLNVAREVFGALPRDLIRSLRRGSAIPIRLDPGVRPGSDVRCIALYVHYSATGHVSEMVRRQLDLLGKLGFGIVFITAAAQIPEEDWQAVRHLCALVVQRRNFGRDFGAWQDVIPEVARRWPHLEELMLVNDSVLGPIRALHPVFDTMRSGGAGFFGLTESLQGGPHLQSYMLLARGRSAVADLMRFIKAIPISDSKWLLIQLGEIRLARWMRKRGHRVGAVFGYDRMIQAVVADPAQRRRLEESHSKLQGLTAMPENRAVELLREWPVNPTHHMWHLLATRLGDPFLKTELVLRNPGRLPDVADWPTVVPPDSPCSLSVLQAHLETMKSS